MAASATSMKTKKTFGQWFKRRKVQQWLVIVSFLIVPVLLLLVFILLAEAAIAFPPS